jgi:hypothetical protein
MFLIIRLEVRVSYFTNSAAIRQSIEVGTSNMCDENVITGVGRNIGERRERDKVRKG